jgi:hypothetical protein
MKCKPVRINASSFADNVSPTVISFAINVSPKQRQMRAQPISNASRYRYVEFGDGAGKFEKPLMTYVGPQDEEGAFNQASFSFYAFLPREDFQNLVSLGHDAQVILYIRTEDLDGPIQFGSDIDGYEKIWKTEMGTRVAAESFELLIIYSGAEVI